MFIPTCSEPTVPVTACCTVTLSGARPVYTYGCLEGAVLGALCERDVLDTVREAVSEATISAVVEACEFDVEYAVERLMALACI